MSHFNCSDAPRGPAARIKLAQRIAEMIGEGLARLAEKGIR